MLRRKKSNRLDNHLLQKVSIENYPQKNKKCHIHSTGGTQDEHRTNTHISCCNMHANIATGATQSVHTYVPVSMATIVPLLLTLMLRMRVFSALGIVYAEEEVEEEGVSALSLASLL